MPKLSQTTPERLRIRRVTGCYVEDVQEVEAKMRSMSECPLESLDDAAFDTLAKEAFLELNFF